MPPRELEFPAAGVKGWSSRASAAAERSANRKSNQYIDNRRQIGGLIRLTAAQTAIDLAVEKRDKLFADLVRQRALLATVEAHAIQTGRVHPTAMAKTFAISMTERLIAEADVTIAAARADHAAEAAAQAAMGPVTDETATAAAPAKAARRRA